MAPPKPRPIRLINSSRPQRKAGLGPMSKTIGKAPILKFGKSISNLKK